MYMPIHVTQHQALMFVYFCIGVGDSGPVSPRLDAFLSGVLPEEILVNEIHEAVVARDGDWANKVDDERQRQLHARDLFCDFLDAVSMRLRNPKHDAPYEFQRDEKAAGDH